MPTDKRQRKRDGRLARIEAERAAARVAARRRRIITAVIATVAVFGVLLFLSQTGGDDDEGTAADAPTTTTGEAGAGRRGGAVRGHAVRAGDEARGAGGAGAQLRLPLRGTAWRAASTTPPTVTTSAGPFTFDLLEADAPGAVNNFVNLARSGYYDGSTFHRVLEGFVIQGGDPVGQPAGTGGPGYAIADELPGAGEYEVGSVAMANSGPDTSGSQFFVVTGEEGVGLPPSYTLFGTVTMGMDVVSAIEAEPGEPPDAPVEVTSVEIIEARGERLSEGCAEGPGRATAARRGRPRRRPATPTSCPPPPERHEPCPSRTSAVRSSMPTTVMPPVTRSRVRR
jgi:cyclophilin family peptidyl-prolyl cis-trans isomerase